MSIKNYFTKKQNTYLKVLQLRYCGRDSIIQVRNRPYFHYGLSFCGELQVKVYLPLLGSKTDCMIKDTK